MPPHGKRKDAFPRWGYWAVGAFVSVLLTLLFVNSNAPSRLWQIVQPALESGFSLLFIAVGALLYMLPWFIARGSPRAAAIFVANLIFGWTCVGWIIVFIWGLAEAGSQEHKNRDRVPPRP